MFKLITIWVLIMLSNIVYSLVEFPIIVKGVKKRTEGIGISEVVVQLKFSNNSKEILQIPIYTNEKYPGYNTSDIDTDCKGKISINDNAYLTSIVYFEKHLVLDKAHKKEGLYIINNMIRPLPVRKWG
jgi:hypothetical protein